MLAGAVEVKPDVGKIQSYSVGGLLSLSQQIESLDLLALSSSEQGQVRALLQKYQTVFSDNNKNIGCTCLIFHDIPLSLNC